MAQRLKDSFDIRVVHRLAQEIAAEWASFDASAFRADALDGFEVMELMARGRHLALTLHRHLPPVYDEAVSILLKTLPVRVEPEGGMASFYFLPHTEFIRIYGSERHARFATSMRALHALTQRFTAEFAIRPFLAKYPHETLAQLRQWTGDSSEHGRRLVSEGTRPRLPWAPRLTVFDDNPEPVLALLETLKDDPSAYVRRSVANHLNDIGKQHPAQLLAVAHAWFSDASAERRALVQHALRMLVKQGNSDALSILGYHGPSALTVTSHTISPMQVTIGERVMATVTVKNTTDVMQRAVLDLIVHFVKANGTTSAKVFKLSNVQLAGRDIATVRKSVSLAALTTRTPYPGIHRVELQINGVVMALGAFVVLA